MIAEHKHLVQQGAELVELRLDYIKRAVNLKRLLTDRPCPVVATCRREQDGGKWEGTEDDRLMLLRSAIADGVEYVDLEEDIAGSIPRYGNTKRIISYHNFRETPNDVEKIHARLVALDADIVKIATMAHHPRDNLRVLRLGRDSNVPTIGICMGEIGTPSRILAGKFAAPFSYATFSHERQLAPGQLTYNQMKNIYHYESINKDTKVYGVIADPIGHSLSPLIHNAAIEAMQQNNVYVPFRVPHEDLDDFLADCEELAIKGLSVTIPHKEAVIRHLSKVDGAVRGIGAVNTIVFNDNKAFGYNTDVRAAMESLENAVNARGKSPVEAPLARKTALILGAGGVAKAIAFGLKRRKVKVSIAARTRNRAFELAKQFESHLVEWNDRHAEPTDLLINCTPVGMHPNVDETPYESKHLRANTIVFDTVYNPEQTFLIKEARKRGCDTVTGVDMFVRQAAMQFELFTGNPAPEEEMRAKIKRATGAARYE